jgi:hypothetical protein
VIEIGPAAGRVVETAVVDSFDEAEFVDFEVIDAYVVNVVDALLVAVDVL